MRDRFTVDCKKCKGRTNVKFCKKCISLTCERCLSIVEIPEFKCPACEEISLFEDCVSCGIPTEPYNINRSVHCPFCESTDLGDPFKIKDEITQSFIDLMESLQEYGQSLLSLHKRFDRIVAIVRIGRKAGFYGYPSIETDLSHIKAELTKTSQLAIQELDKIRKTANHVVREMKTNDLDDLELYPIFVSHVSSIEQRIQIFKKNLDTVFDRLKQMLEDVSPKLKLLLYHRANFEEIRHFFPEDLTVSGVVATLINLDVEYEEGNLKKSKFKAALVFLDRGMLLCPQHPTKKIGIKKFPYSDLKERRLISPLLKSLRYLVEFRNGKIRIFGTPSTLDSVASYFEWVGQKPPSELVVDGPEKIIAIDVDSPDGSILKREIETLVVEIRSAIEGTTNQRRPIYPISQGITALKSRIGDIDAQINYLIKEYSTYSVPPQSILDQILSLKEERNHLAGQMKGFGYGNRGIGTTNTAPTAPEQGRYGDFNRYGMN